MKPQRYIYFIRPVGSRGPIKIGLSCDPEKRMAQFHNFSPVPLELLAKMPGSPADEARLHAKYAHNHSHGEWFHWSPELIADICSIRAGTFDPASLPKMVAGYKSRRSVNTRRFSLAKAAA